jgi:hypothetical protein
MKKLLFLTMMVLSACESGEKKGDEGQLETIIETNEDQTPREPVTYLRSTIELPNSVLADFNRIRKNHKYIPYFCQTQDGNLFLTCNRKIEAFELRDEKKRDNIRFGLVDGEGNKLLPNEYNKIGNPGIFADGYVEVNKNGKYRLYDYINKRMMLEEFEVIYPSNIMGYLAIGRRNDGFYKLYDDGTIQKIVNKNFIPSYKSISEKLKFDVRSEEFGLWINTELFSAENKNEIEAGLYIPPSFIDVLKIIPSFISDVTIKGSQLGTEEFKTTKIEHKKRNNDISSMVVAFMDQGLDGRGWMAEQQHLITTIKDNKIKSKLKLGSISDYDKQNICANCDATGFRFVNDSILEVKYWMFSENDDAIPGMDSLFVSMTHFSYFEILPTGKISKLHEGSIFPMGSVIKLNKENLKGCFLKNKQQYPDLFSFPVLENFSDFEGESDMGWVLEFNQLAAGDIRFMINEIYARHGYIFADKKLNAYFRSKSWYNAKTKNVDNLLTPIEKYNIDFLKGVEKQLKENEREILQPKRKFMVWAG